MWRVPGHRPGRRRRGAARVGPAVWLAGGVCAASFALLAYGLVRKLGGREMPAGDSPRPEGGPMRISAPTAATSPADWAANPLAGTGTERLERDPPEAVVPPGGVRRSGHRRLLPDGTADVITYVVESDLPAAEEFYRCTLAAAGYRLVTRADRDAAVKGGPGIVLGFRAAQGQQYYVMLIPTDNGERLKIVLVIARQGRTGS